MSANRLFLVCSHCREIESSLLLAERADGDSQYTASKLKRADDWFAKHQLCGNDVDKFQVAYHRPLNWDLSPPAQDTVAGAVKLELAVASLNGADH